MPRAAGSPAHSSRLRLSSCARRDRCLLARDDGANTLQPSRWPTGPGASPRMEADAHALRFLGNDRFESTSR